MAAATTVAPLAAVIGVDNESIANNTMNDAPATNATTTAVDRTSARCGRRLVFIRCRSLATVQVNGTPPHTETDTHHRRTETPRHCQRKHAS